MGVTSSESPSCPPSGFGGEAISHADRAAGAVVVAGAQPARSEPQFRVDRDPFEESELGQVEYGVFLIGSAQADQMIEHFGDPYGREGSIAAVEEGSDVVGSRFCSQVGDDGVGV